MQDYVRISLETHLFFGRIMKEHALFLVAGFPCKEEKWIDKADCFRQQFEELLWDALKLSNGIISGNVVKSQELVTRFTIPAEQKTEQLTGIPIDSRISAMEQKLQAGCHMRDIQRLTSVVNEINQRSICLLDGLIEFKESILREVSRCALFTANYPLLIKHIIREAKLYRSTIIELRQNNVVVHKNLCEIEQFWNQIMMEHALFIRGLLDPSETELIETADEFAAQYEELLQMAKERDCMAIGQLTRDSLNETLKYREFKAAGTEGIVGCKISSIILPLLADHVLREANHYIRILESGYNRGCGNS